MNADRRRQEVRELLDQLEGCDADWERLKATVDACFLSSDVPEPLPRWVVMVAFGVVAAGVVVFALLAMLLGWIP